MVIVSNSDAALAFPRWDSCWKTKSRLIVMSPRAADLSSSNIPPIAVQSRSRSSGEPGVPGKGRGHESVPNVEAVRDGRLAADGPVVSTLVGSLFLCGDCHAGDAALERDDRIDTAREGQLHGTANLTGVRPRGHDGSKSAHVVVVPAHLPPAQIDLGALGLALVALASVGVLLRVQVDADVAVCLRKSDH